MKISIKIFFIFLVLLLAISSYKKISRMKEVINEETRLSKIGLHFVRRYDNTQQTIDWHLLKVDLEREGYLFKENTIIPLDKWGNEVVIKIQHINKVGRYLIITSPGRDGELETEDDILYELAY